MSGDIVVQNAPRQSSQDRLLAMIQKQYPSYHPVVAMVKIAHEQEQDDEGDAGLAFACHKEVAKYVVQVDKFVEVKSEITKTKRVVVELFAGSDHPDKAKPPVLQADGSEVLDAPVLGADRVGSSVTGTEKTVTVRQSGPLEEMWADPGERGMIERFT